MDICAVILAATDTSLMCSEMTKFVHPIAGKALISWIKDALEEAEARDQIYVVGTEHKQIRNVIGDDVAYVIQENPKGTGHAVMQASSFLEGRNGITLIVHGNTPLVRGKLLKSMIRRFQSGDYKALIMSSLTTRPDGFDRIMRDDENQIIGILKDELCDDDFCGLSEVTAGVYCFDTALLLSTMGKIWSYQSIEGGEDEEFKRTLSFADIIEQFSREGHRLETYQVPFEDIIKVNTRFGLEEARQEMSWRICKKHMDAGVTIMDPSSTRIDAEVTIGMDTEISPACTIKGCTEIGSHVKLSRSCSIENSVISDACQLEASNVKNSFLGENVKIGPYVHIYGGSFIGRDTEIGSFCELKSSQIGEKGKLEAGVVMSDVFASNSVYIGANSSVGAKDAKNGREEIEKPSGKQGFSFQGKEDKLIKLGEHVVIGPSSCLIAPMEVRDHAFIASGSVIARNVPAFSLAAGDADDMLINDWVMDRYKSGKSLSFRAANRAVERLNAKKNKRDIEKILNKEER